MEEQRMMRRAEDDVYLLRFLPTHLHLRSLSRFPSLPALYLLCEDDWGRVRGCSLPVPGSRSAGTVEKSGGQRAGSGMALHEAIFLATCNATNQAARKNSRVTPHFVTTIVALRVARKVERLSTFRNVARQVACV